MDEIMVSDERALKALDNGRIIKNYLEYDANPSDVEFIMHILINKSAISAVLSLRFPIDLERRAIIRNVKRIVQRGFELARTEEDWLALAKMGYPETKSSWTKMSMRDFVVRLIVENLASLAVFEPRDNTVSQLRQLPVFDSGTGGFKLIAGSPFGEGGILHLGQLYSHGSDVSTFKQISALGDRDLIDAYFQNSRSADDVHHLLQIGFDSDLFEQVSINDSKWNQIVDGLRFIAMHGFDGTTNLNDWFEIAGFPYRSNSKLAGVVPHIIVSNFGSLMRLEGAKDALPSLKDLPALRDHTQLASETFKTATETHRTRTMGAYSAACRTEVGALNYLKVLK